MANGISIQIQVNRRLTTIEKELLALKRLFFAYLQKQQAISERLPFDPDIDEKNYKEFAAALEEAKEKVFASTYPKLYAQIFKGKK